MSKNITKKVGRPPKITTDVVGKLEHAFSVGASDTEACSYAGISRQTYYSYVKDNIQFLDRVNELKIKLPMKAKTELSHLINAGNEKAIFWYLDRVDKRDKKDEENQENQLLLESLIADELKRLNAIRKYQPSEMDRLEEYALCIAQVKIMRARMAQQGEVLYSEKSGGVYSNPLINQIQSIQNRMDKLRDALFPPNKDAGIEVVKDIRDEFI